MLVRSSGTSETQDSFTLVAVGSSRDSFTGTENTLMLCSFIVFCRGTLECCINAVLSYVSTAGEPTTQNSHTWRLFLDRFLANRHAACSFLPSSQEISYTFRCRFNLRSRYTVSSFVAVNKICSRIDHYVRLTL